MAQPHAKPRKVTPLLSSPLPTWISMKQKHLNPGLFSLKTVIRFDREEASAEYFKKCDFPCPGLVSVVVGFSQYENGRSTRFAPGCQLFLGRDCYLLRNYCPLEPRYAMAATDIFTRPPYEQGYGI
jgi:hypothetical protein